MSFIKRGDAQPIINIYDMPEEVAQDLLENVNKLKEDDTPEDRKDINVS